MSVKDTVRCMLAKILPVPMGTARVSPQAASALAQKLYRRSIRTLVGRNIGGSRHNKENVNINYLLPTPF